MAVAYIANCTQSTANLVRRVLDSVLFEIKPVMHKETFYLEDYYYFIYHRTLTTNLHLMSLSSCQFRTNDDFNEGRNCGHICRGM